MAEKLQLFECEACGHVVMVFRKGGGTLVCCNQPMAARVENTVDAAKEKHVPVVEKTETGFKVKVGSVAHPMTAEHLIEWVELHAGGAMLVKFLAPGDAPEVEFKPCDQDATARSYCNLHGYWKG